MKGKSTIDAVLNLSDFFFFFLQPWRGRNTPLVFSLISPRLLIVLASIIRNAPRKCMGSESHFSTGLNICATGSRSQSVCVHSICVQVSEVLSDPISLKSGVPRGSILTPVLFVMYINNLNDRLRAGNLNPVCRRHNWGWNKCFYSNS